MTSKSIYKTPKNQQKHLLQDTRLIYKSKSLSLTGNEQFEFEVKNTPPFKTAPKKRKLNINLTKYVQGLYMWETTKL